DAVEDHLVDVLDRRRRLGDARVRVEDVETSPPCHRRGNRGLVVDASADISAQCQRLPASPLERLRGVLGRILAEIDHAAAAAFTREQQRRRAPDAGTGPGYQRDLVTELHQTPPECSPSVDTPLV